MGTACTGSSKKPKTDVSGITVSSSKQNNIEIDVVPGDLIPKDLIQRTLRKADSDLDDVQELASSPAKEIDKKRKEKRAKKVVNNEEEATVFENFTKTSKKLSEQDILMIIKYLKTHFLFYDLSEPDLENIVSKMFHCEVEANQFVFKQGDNASCYFILNSGKVQIIVNEDVKKTLQKGEGFGELALLYNAPRSASVKTVEKCQLWTIDRVTFRKAFEEMVSKQVNENRSFMDNVAFFNNLTDQQKNAIVNVISSQKFKKGEAIVVEGDPASSFYVIKEGMVSVLKGEKEIRKMGKGDSFGEQALYYKTFRFCTVKADTEVKCLALGREEATKILGEQVQLITFKNLMRWAFEKSPKLKKLTNLHVEKIIANMNISQMKKGDLVFRKGDPLDRFIIVIDGALKMKNSKDIVAGKGAAFGEEFLGERVKEQLFSNDVYLDSDGIIAAITLKEFLIHIGGDWETAVQKSQASHEKTVIQKQFDAGAVHGSSQNKHQDLILEDFISIKKLGYGQFGSVYLVKNKKNGNLYALKSISKNQILEQNLERHLLQEKTVLELVDFPFVMTFYRSFKDSSNIYFLEEYVKGVELFDAIRDIGLLKTYDSQFYTASLILALEYLHSRSVIYRDIKPENIMVDEKGYLKLIDMGTAKIIGGKHHDRTFTIIGTPHYMAPEIITGKGYSYAVDLWSIGICVYEFLCGGVPFAEDADDPYEIYEEIIKKPIAYPNFLKDKKARKIIDQMLSKVPEIRLGGSYASLKTNLWFSNFDWDKLFLKELLAPYFPPKGKLINQNEIAKMEQINKLFVDVIKTDTKASKKVVQAKDPNWDKNY